MAGYFLCGFLIANSGISQVLGQDPAANRSLFDLLAEIGVVLLMFTLGIEFSLKELAHLRKLALRGGGAQMGLTGALGMGISLAMGYSWSQSFFLGFTFALCSTAVSMKMFEDLGQGNNPGARTALAIALFQDILVILFVMLLPALFGTGGGNAVWAVADALGRGVLFLGLSWVLGKFVIPHLLEAVSKTRSRELFTITVLGLCAGIAMLGAGLKLNLALGAFAAGVVVSESVYSHRILAEILPFKDFFLTLFFVSVGLGIDANVFMEHWIFYLLAVAGILVVKWAIGIFAAKVAGISARSWVLAGLGVASVGEFALVLAGSARSLGGIGEKEQQFLLIIAALSMSLLPILAKLNKPLSKWLDRFSWSRRLPDEKDAPLSKRIRKMEDHAIVCGYGEVGQSVVRSLNDQDITSLVIELNSDTAKRLIQQGQPVLYADAAHAETLALARLETARMLVFTYPDFKSVCAAIREARLSRPDIAIFCRARYPSEVADLEELGVDGIVDDERESAAAMLRLTNTAGSI